MKKNTKSKNKILYIDMDGTLTEFRHKDKVTIDDWEDKDIFAYPEICTSTIIGICDKIHMKEEPFNKIDKIYIITQVPYTNYTHHCKNKKETYDVISAIFWKKAIELDGIIFVNTEKYENKVMYIINQQPLNMENYILIDDTHSLLREFELLGGTAYHVSSFL